MPNFFKTFSSIKQSLPPFSSLSRKRKKQLLLLQTLSILSASSEVFNFTALIPFLQVLSDPSSFIENLPPFFLILKTFNENQLSILFGFAFLSLLTVSTFLRVITISFQLRLSALISTDLALKTFSTFLHKPYLWHISNNSSKLIGNLTNDINLVSGIIKSLLVFFTNSLIVLFLAGALLIYQPQITIIFALILLFVYTLLFKLTKSRVVKQSLLLAENYELSLKCTQETMGSIRDVIHDKKFNFYLEKYEDSYKNYAVSITNIATRAQLPRYIIEASAIVVIVLSILVLLFLGVNIQSKLPVMGVLILGLYRILTPLQQCFASITSILGAKGSLMRIRPYLLEEVRDRNYTILNKEIYRESPIIKSALPAISLEQLSFKYPGTDKLILNDINLTISAGQKIAFVGETGSGKSTLVDIILGLLEPTNGHLKIMGESITNIQNIDLSALISHVPQQIFLVDDSVSNNIAFGNNSRNIDFDLMYFAAKQAKIYETILSKDNGFDTIVGERGLKLSGGQRQRLGIARALYKQTPIIVLDEATSALDNRTELEVMDNLVKDQNTTILAITHRLSTIRSFDRIIFLENGRITGDDSFDNLLSYHQSFIKLNHSVIN